MLQNKGATNVNANFCQHSFAGCPSIVRSDHSTENATLAACHMALYDDDFSGEKSFRFQEMQSSWVVVCLSASTVQLTGNVVGTRTMRHTSTR